MKNTVFIIIFVLLLIGGIAGVLYAASQGSRTAPIMTVAPNMSPNSPNQATTPVTSPAITPNVTDEFKSGSWETFTSTTYSFDYPGSWSPAKVTAAGANNEIITLGIPGIQSTQTIGYSTTNVTNEKPDTVTEEEQITIGGRQGYKWTSKGTGYVNYRYATTGKGSGSFVIDVMATKEDEGLEFSLDQLAGSIRFK